MTQTNMNAHAHADHATSPGGGFFARLFDVYMPRQACMNYEQDVVWLHVFADSLIVLAYFSIPLALIVFVRRRKDLEFHWIYLMFAAFIVSCGLTHLFNIFAIWQPLYRLDGVVKLLTGAVSVATAVALWPLIPRALALPSPRQLREANEALERSNDALEARVSQRTTELSARHDELTREVEMRKEIEQALLTAQAQRDELLKSERTARSEAEYANRMKDEFVATLSHELRTPISAIMGWVQQLRKGDTSHLHHAIEVIDRNTRTQAQMIEDLLDMSRISSGKMRLEVQVTDLRGIIEAAVESVQPAAEARGVRLMQVLDPDAGPVKGDPSRLQQVVWNLLANAIKFTPRGGRVQIVLQRINSHIEITVADTGKGISPDFLPYVFDRFRQSEQDTRRSSGGLGLGLSIVRNLVEMHGGSVTVQSEGENLGATFTVVLPLAVVTSESSSKRRHPSSGEDDPISLDEPSLKGVRVLAVDDDPDARDLIGHVLRDYGAEVITANGFDAAIEQLDTQEFDVLISDIGMPDRDGFDLIRAVRARSSSDSKIPAIAMTAFARPQDRMRALLAGFQAHIAKPAESTEIAATIGALLGLANQEPNRE